MNTNIVISLDTRRKRKDGSYPIILRLSHKRKTNSISLGSAVPLEYWDKKKRLVKKSYKGVTSVTRLNNLFLKKKSDALEVITKLEAREELHLLSIKQLKEKITNDKKAKSASFFDFGQKLAEEMMQAKRVGNARSYKLFLTILKSYAKGRDLTFEDINYDFIKKWETTHLAKGNKVNGFASYMRTLRAIYNKGIQAGLVDKKAYPFERYKIKTTPTEKRAISIDSLKKILVLELDQKHELFHVRNMFIASYLLYGMNFMDMVYLKTSNIINGRIKYRRRKTAKLYDIKITEQLQEILNFYTNGKSDDEYVFPAIKRNNLNEQYKDIEWARKKFNKGLKKLAALCGIEETLTSYVARHSFATQAMMNDVPLQAISAMLGHSKLSTTQIYLASLPSEVMDEYHDKLKL